MSEINNGRVMRIVGILNTWVSGYISPSAQIAIKDGIDLIEDLLEENESLRDELSKYKKQESINVDDIEF